MKLNVPVIRQPKDSVDCGIAGAVMILQYYGIDKTFAQAKKEINVAAIGTYSPQIGTYLINRGFDVTIVTLHPFLFTLADKKMNADAIKNRIIQREKTMKSADKKLCMSYFREFLENGGKIKVEIPNLKHIKTEIYAKRPIGALLTSNFLKAKIPVFNFHFNIITGIDSKFIYVNDPLWNERGGKQRYTKEDFLFGLYASAAGDPDNASLILVKPKTGNSKKHVNL